MDKIVARNILEWIQALKCIPEEQFGFLPGCSTTSQLIHCFQNWKAALNSGKCIEIVYFDLSKAFDTVDHLGLISKLESIGIRGNLLSWFESYLDGREFSVRFDDKQSPRKTCSSGVPQGSVLSPILFNIYTMDLPKVLKTDPRISVAVYADDIKIYASYDSSDMNEVQEKLQLSVQRMLDWADKWRIKINLSKSQVLRLGGIAVDINYGVPLDVQQKVRDLGVFLDSSLNFSSHIDTIISNATRTLYSVLRNVHSSDISILLRLYKAYVLPILEYCSPLWNPNLKKDILKLENVQRAFTRILFYRAFPNKDYPRALPDYKTRLRILGLKSLFYRRVVADITLGFKILRGEVRLNTSRF
ncbi:hypothetical protein Y032_0930g3087 [Ancylostoma ceylanicum]|uniref:Reverse transcriptase domain-containing protein n=1 Tax=Ancylostoma ceylanicum TaxID=53326 RepID=A0A016WA38_9BILA|nr:hypothetical protein Y032_0930g3087 [Ancylostoma ceylanicum]